MQIDIVWSPAWILLTKRDHFAKKISSSKNSFKKYLLQISKEPVLQSYILKDTVVLISIFFLIDFLNLFSLKIP